MSDQGFREIQLSGKQVVFLFMAVTVALVGTFLLGVSVGKGVNATDITVKPTPTLAESDQSAPLPPATVVKPGVIEYPKTLQDKPVTGEAPLVVPTPTPADKPADKPVVTPTPDVKAPAPEPAKASGTWFVVVDSYSSKANADRGVAELKAKGFSSAKAYTAPGSGAHFKTRLGPFDRAAADAMVARLRKAGYKPSAPSR